MIAQVHEDHIAVLPRGEEWVVRRAVHADVVGIARIVAEYARRGDLLPRSAENIRATLPDWVVAEADGAIVACGSLLEMDVGLAEVRSLVVAPAYRSYGVGAQIVRALVREAGRRGIPTVFALTRAVRFFERLGFLVTDKERFPAKVMRDCALCPLQDRCDETAVILEAPSAPE